MNSRDVFFVVGGMLLAVVGIGALLYGSITIALITIFLLIALLLLLLVLQRRQLAAVQERTLRIMRAQKESYSQLEAMAKRSRSTRQRDNTELSTKKIIGMLSAQQISMELLNKRIEEIARRTERER